MGVESVPLEHSPAAASALNDYFQAVSSLASKYFDKIPEVPSWHDTWLAATRTTPSAPSSSSSSSSSPSGPCFRAEHAEAPAEGTSSTSRARRSMTSSQSSSPSPLRATHARRVARARLHPHHRRRRKQQTQDQHRFPQRRKAHPGRQPRQLQLHQPRRPRCRKGKGHRDAPKLRRRKLLPRLLRHHRRPHAARVRHCSIPRHPKLHHLQSGLQHHLLRHPRLLQARRHHRRRPRRQLRHPEGHPDLALHRLLVRSQRHRLAPGRPRAGQARHKAQNGPLTRRFIVTEGVFEADGALSDLPKIQELKKRHKFRLILDESISFGTVGATGRGLTELLQHPPSDVEILVGSMATRSVPPAASALAPTRSSTTSASTEPRLSFPPPSPPCSPSLPAPPSPTWSRNLRSSLRSPRKRQDASLRSRPRRIAPHLERSAQSSRAPPDPQQDRSPSRHPSDKFDKGKNSLAVGDVSLTLANSNDEKRIAAAAPPSTISPSTSRCVCSRPSSTMRWSMASSSRA